MAAHGDPIRGPMIPARRRLGGVALAAAVTGGAGADPGWWRGWAGALAALALLATAALVLWLGKRLGLASPSGWQELDDDDDIAWPTAVSGAVPTPPQPAQAVTAAVVPPPAAAPSDQPADEAPSSPLTSAAAAPAAVGPTVAGSAILVVEDDLVIRKLVEVYLSQLGFAVEVVETGEEALAVVEQGGARLGLVFTDLTLPEMGGGELFDRCRALYPQLPFIFASGDPLALAASSLAGAPHTGRLAKPFDVFALRREVERFLAPPAAGS